MTYFTWLPPWAWAVVLIVGIAAMLWLNARPESFWDKSVPPERERARL